MDFLLIKWILKKISVSCIKNWEKSTPKLLGVRLMSQNGKNSFIIFFLSNLIMTMLQKRDCISFKVSEKQISYWNCFCTVSTGSRDRSRSSALGNRMKFGNRVELVGRMKFGVENERADQNRTRPNLHQMLKQIPSRNKIWILLNLFYMGRSVMSK